MVKVLTIEIGNELCVVRNLGDLKHAMELYFGLDDDNDPIDLCIDGEGDDEIKFVWSEMTQEELDGLPGYEDVI